MQGESIRQAGISAVKGVTRKLRDSDWGDTCLLTEAYTASGVPQKLRAELKATLWWWAMRRGDSRFFSGLQSQLSFQPPYNLISTSKIVFCFSCDKRSLILGFWSLRLSSWYVQGQCAGAQDCLIRQWCLVFPLYWRKWQDKWLWSILGIFFFYCLSLFVEPCTGLHLRCFVSLLMKKFQKYLIWWWKQSQVSETESFFIWMFLPWS